MLYVYNKILLTIGICIISTGWPRFLNHQHTGKSWHILSGLYIFLVSAIQKTPTIFRKKKNPICPNLSNLKNVARIREETNDTNSPTQIFRPRKMNECPFFKGTISFGVL